jgi:diphthine-ammonia ligase
MTVTALVSGGKDSIYAAYLADTQGWPVDELLTVEPTDRESEMLHTPNLHVVALQAAAWGKRARTVKVPATGAPAELESLREALAADSGPVVVGAIVSSYQWSRVVRICDALGRRVYAPLWRTAPGRVVREEISAGLDIRLVHLAAEPLTPDLLGRRLDPELLAELERRSDTVRRMNVAGEGGEFETLVVDAPFFHSRIILDRTGAFESPGVAGLRVIEAHLEEKPVGGAAA